MPSKLRTGFAVIALVLLTWLGMGYYNAVTKPVVQNRLILEIEKGASFGGNHSETSIPKHSCKPVLVQGSRLPTRHNKQAKTRRIRANSRFNS